MGIELRQASEHRRRPGPPPEGAPPTSASTASSCTSLPQPSSAIRDSEDVVADLRMGSEMEAQVSSLILGSLEVNEASSVVADLGPPNVFTTEVDACRSHDFDKMLNLLLLSDVGPGKPTKADMEQIVNVCLSMMCAVDFSEVYSPARFRDCAWPGLSPGLAAELITGWDLRSRMQRYACTKKLAEEKPHFLVASPPCTAFSALQRISRMKRDSEKVMEQMK